MHIMTMQLGPIGTNCYILRRDRDSREAVVIDPGDEPDRIIALLRDQGVRPAAILLTHGHLDHILAVNDLLGEWPDTELVIGEDERPMVGDSALNCGALMGVTCEIAPTRYVRDREEVLYGDISLRVIASPGHTGGSVCYYQEEERLLFAGDTIFYRGYGRTDLPTGDFETLMRSLERIYASLPEDTRVLPGHGPATTISREKSWF